MRMYPTKFPANRLKKPKRRAEHRIYEALAGSERRGFVYYEWRKDYECIEIDFAAWIPDLARFALQVKGGRYLLIDGGWYLKTRNGAVPVNTSPLDEAWLAALDLHDDIKERAGVAYNPFVVPVVVFADMEPNRDIALLARRKGVYLIWRTGDLMADLTTIIQSRRMGHVLPMGRIVREVAAVTDGLIQLNPSSGQETRAETSRPAGLSLSAGGLKLMQIRAAKMHSQLRTIISFRRRPLLSQQGGPAGVSNPDPQSNQ